MQDQQSKRCTTCGKHLVANELRPKIGSAKMVCDACLLEKEGQQLHQMRHKYERTNYHLKTSHFIRLEEGR